MDKCSITMAFSNDTAMMLLQLIEIDRLKSKIKDRPLSLSELKLRHFFIDIVINNIDDLYDLVDNTMSDKLVQLVRHICVGALMSHKNIVFENNSPIKCINNKE